MTLRLTVIFDKVDIERHKEQYSMLLYVILKVLVIFCRNRPQSLTLTKKRLLVDLNTYSGTSFDEIKFISLNLGDDYSRFTFDHF